MLKLSIRVKETKGTYYLYVWRQKFGDLQPFDEGFEGREQVLDVEHVALHRPEPLDQILDVLFDVEPLPGPAVVDDVERGQVLLAAPHPVDLRTVDEKFSTALIVARSYNIPVLTFSSYASFLY